MDLPSTMAVHLNLQPSVSVSIAEQSDGKAKVRQDKAGTKQIISW